MRVARALGKLPAIDEAFRSARLSYAKVRALTRVPTAENEGRLLALVATAAQLEPGEYVGQAYLPGMSSRAGRRGGDGAAS